MAFGLGRIIRTVSACSLTRKRLSTATVALSLPSIAVAVMTMTPPAVVFAGNGISIGTVVEVTALVNTESICSVNPPVIVTDTVRSPRLSEAETLNTIPSDTWSVSPWVLTIWTRGGDWSSSKPWPTRCSLHADNNATHPRARTVP